jgi:hypothetical protein
MFPRGWTVRVTGDAPAATATAARTASATPTPAAAVLTRRGQPLLEELAPAS